MFFSSTTIKIAMINIPCSIFTYDDEGGPCDSILWPTLRKIFVDLYIYNIHNKPLYICIMVK